MHSGNHYFRYLRNFSFTCLALLLCSCSSGITLQSQWKNTDDMKGSTAQELQKSLQALPDNNINVGFSNDDKFLYLDLSAKNRSAIMQIIRSGLVVRFSPESGKKFGIKFPLQPERKEMDQLQDNDPEGIHRHKPGEMPQTNTNDELPGLIPGQQHEFRIVDENDEPLYSLPLPNDEGIDVSLSMNGGTLFYRLKMPLKTSGDYSFALGAAPGENVHVTIETQQRKMPDMKNDMPRRSGSRPDDAMASPDGNRPDDGNMRRMPPGAMQQQESLKAEINLHLAAQPGQAR